MNGLTQLTEPTTEDRNYRCIDGQWKDLPRQSNWGNSDAGFCAQESQCFVSSGGDPEFGATEFFEDDTKVKVPSCINTGEYLMDNYCENGNWTSRTKHLVLSMANLLNAADEYEFYCTAPGEAFGDMAEGDRDILIGGMVRDTNDDSGMQRGDATGIVRPNVCFPQAHGIISDNEDTCINNVCVLKYKRGSEWKVAFATTLNKPLNQPDSFITATPFRLEPVSPETACPGEGEFTLCNFGPTFSGNAWYSKPLNALIYAPEGEDLPLDGTLGQQFIDWLKGLFGAESTLSDEESFVKTAQNFREIYLAHRSDSDQKVRAIKELFVHNKSIVAEYENFDTPVCEYTVPTGYPYITRVPVTGFTTELLPEVQGKTLIACTVNGNIQRVEATGETEAINQLWPQLTGKLRQG